MGICKQIRYLELIAANNFISRAEIARELGVHDSSVKRRLNSLIADGLIRRVGPAKGGHWEIITPENIN